MRIAHTSDWHLGRRWKGQRRLDEMEAVLDHLASFIESESIDLVVHSGDVFDTRHPPAEAERLANEFFVRVGKAGVPSVVIAGNHDDPKRFDARAMLVEFASVTMLGRPRSAAEGGTVRIETKCGEAAMVACLPFASAGAWVSALDLSGDETKARTKYARMFQLAVGNLCAGFAADTVNLFTAHTHIHGAVLAESERRVHVGEDWAATAETLPNAASYIALGHIHKPQKLGGLLPARYAGSPLQLDFGEAGQDKSFVVVEASPGKPARTDCIPYEGGKALLDVRASLEQLEAKAPTLAESGWLRVSVPLAKRDPDINRKVRELLPNALVVRVELPKEEREAVERPDASAVPSAHYSAYHRREHGSDPEADVLETFEGLYEEATGSSDAAGTNRAAGDDV